MNPVHDNTVHFLADSIKSIFPWNADVREILDQFLKLDNYTFDLGMLFLGGQVLSHDTQGLGARFPKLLEFLPGREIVSLLQILVDGSL